MKNISKIFWNGSFIKNKSQLMKTAHRIWIIFISLAFRMKLNLSLYRRTLLINNRFLQEIKIHFLKSFLFFKKISWSQKRCFNSLFESFSNQHLKTWHLLLDYSKLCWLMKEVSCSFKTNRIPQLWPFWLIF